MIGTAEDAQVLRQMPGDSGMWNLVDSVLFMVYFFLQTLPLPVYRPSVSVSLSSLCFVL